MLHGREAELGVLVDRIRAGRAVVVTGEPGVGKTALLRAATAASGRSLHAGGGFASLSWLPYLPLRAVLGGTVPDGDEALLAGAVEAAVGDGVLLVDDLQWCDAGTRAVLALLAGRLPVLGSLRRWDPDAPAVLAELGHPELLELEPLRREAATAVVRDARPGLPPADLDRLLQRCGGNPLLLQELAATGEPSAELRLAVLARLREPAGPVREAFALLSVIGHPVPAARLPGAVELVATGLAVPEGPQVAVRHALLAEVTVDGLEPAELRDLHERAAAVLTDPGARARHLAAAGLRDDARELALAAAASARLPGERAAHLAIAADCAAGPEADRLRLDAATALTEAGQDAAAAALLARVVAATPAERLRVLLLRVGAGWGAGDLDGARAALAEAAALDVPPERRAGIRLAQARAAIFLDGEYALAVEHASAALALGDPAELARAHYLLGTALAMAGRPEWDRQLEAAIAAAAAAGDHDTELRAANNLVGSHEMSGDHAVAAGLAHRMAPRAEALGLVAWQRQFQAMAANLDMLAGRCAAALAAADELLARPLEPRTRDQAEVTRAHALIDLGRLEDAGAQIERSLATAAPDPIGRAQFRYLAAEAEFFAGRPAAAVAALDALLRDVEPGFEITTFARLTRARALAELGRDPGDVEPQPIPFFAAVPDEVAALHALVAGDFAAAAAGFDSAADRWAPYHRRDALLCRRKAGDALRLAGDADAAVERLDRAEREADACGMTVVAAWARRSQRQAGLRRVTPRGAHAGRLAPGERAVLELVRGGLTNAEIATRLGLSRRTVETQLASAAAKLGARSRSQAAALLDDLTDEP